MSTNKTYSYCNGGLLTGIVITSNELPCTYYETWTDAYGVHVRNNGGITFTSASAFPVDITIKYYNRLRNVLNGVDQSVNDAYSNIVLPAGETTITYPHECYFSTNNQYGFSEQYREYWAIMDQEIIPNCGDQPSGCTLTHVSTTITAPSQRGLSDGSIDIVISGGTATNNVSYYLNGVLITSIGSYTGYTFTGLTTGTYNIYVTQDTCYFSNLNNFVPEGEFRTGDFVIPITLPNLVAANNPIIVNVNTANNGSGSQYKSMLSIGSTIANNVNVKFILTSPFSYTQTFYAKHYPNKTNYFLASTLTTSVGVPVGSNTAVEIATSLAQVLNNDAVLPTIYNIESIGGDVFITARENGSRFNLNNNIIISGSNLTYTLLNTGTDQYDGQLTDNYSIYAEVYADSSGKQYPEVGTNANYNKIGELIIPFNSNNQHLFNFSELASSLVDTVRPDKTISTTILVDTMKSYYCKLGEIYPLIANTNTLKKRYKQDINKFWVINSSLEREMNNDMSSYVGDYLSLDGIDSRNNVEFLTKSPDSLYITRESEQYLYFILQKDYQNLLNLNVTIYYNDGTIQYNQNLLQITNTSTNAGGTCFINVSFSNLGLSYYEVGKKIVKYVVQVKQTSCTLSQVVDYSISKSYYVNELSYPEMYGVNFQNSLGMYDTFDFIGETQNTIDRETLTYTKPLSYTNQGAVLEGFKAKAIYSNKVTNKIIVNSGWIDKVHFDWLIELMNSKNIYSYTTPYINYLMIQDFEYIRSTNEDLYNIKITFIETIEENSISI